MHSIKIITVGCFTGFVSAFENILYDLKSNPWFEIYTWIYRHVVRFLHRPLVHCCSLQFKLFLTILFLIMPHLQKDGERERLIPWMPLCWVDFTAGLRQLVCVVHASLCFWRMYMFVQMCPFSKLFTEVFWLSPGLFWCFSPYWYCLLMHIIASTWLTGVVIVCVCVFPGLWISGQLHPEHTCSALPSVWGHWWHRTVPGSGCGWVIVPWRRPALPHRLPGPHQTHSPEHPAGRMCE